MSGAAAAQPAERKLVVVLVDGLRADTARDYMGYLQAQREAGRAQWRTLSCELPSLSRPLYATVINGRTPLEHGIVSNMQPGLRCGTSIFDALAAAGRSSCIAAYHWFYELLAGEVFDPLRHRHAALPALNVPGAAWYYEDEYPDSHLLADAEALRQQHAPNLLFVHPMGLDHAGHVHGGESSAYAMAARKLDMLLALVIPRWQAAGYDLLLTSDHGMNADHMHGGSLAVEREVPLVWLPCVPAAPEAVLPASQLGLRDFALTQLLGAPA
ncbi:alkaline phosphatase family protein [Paucibacter sp. APW11]|uniref:Alkaline phosphatase family protein n=1 Tax=Roseateles aquae TaxID=3077235 RepID=A0ABU3PF41_9BURK|nr:alkaline phosphatase family protein [Paucibacter sp. APW11]MDT9001139.1 alkaline phosphatase family protein [Paucibacter sp. APW11]